VIVPASDFPTTASVAYVLVSGGLSLTIVGPPGGAMANVTVTGPAGFARTVSASQTFSNVLAGTYTITDSNVVVSNATYGTLPSSTTVNVVASTTPTAALVAYALVSGALDLTVLGLPGSVPASVAVTGPGFSQTATASQTFSNILAGTYTVVAQIVSQGGITYGGTLTTQIVVPASLTVITPASVTYAVVPTGQLAVTVTGVPTSLPYPFSPYVLVTGPYNYSQAIQTDGVTALTPIPLGTISITASTVGSPKINRFLCRCRFFPHPPSQSVVITSTSPNGTAAVTYSQSP